MPKLWQTLNKNNLDIFNQLNQKEWNNFVKQNEIEYANKCSEIGEQLFSEFLNK